MADFHQGLRPPHQDRRSQSFESTAYSARRDINGVEMNIKGHIQISNDGGAGNVEVAVTNSTFASGQTYRQAAKGRCVTNKYKHTIVSASNNIDIVAEAVDDANVSFTNANFNAGETFRQRSKGRQVYDQYKNSTVRAKNVVLTARSIVLTKGKQAVKAFSNYSFYKPKSKAPVRESSMT